MYECMQNILVVDAKQDGKTTKVKLANVYLFLKTGEASLQNDARYFCSKIIGLQY